MKALPGLLSNLILDNVRWLALFRKIGDVGGMNNSYSSMIFKITL
jgi:hypothetical protein